jgi:nicotinic acid mononucleotide adenylyltransferase/nicotinamide mononucleotide (NMN) deamidase PncC
MTINQTLMIHKTPYKFYIAVAGGGSVFISDFCSIEGASNNLIGAIVPYNQTVFDKFIGGKSPDSYVSSEAARKLAVASYRECLAVGVESKYSIGIGVTSSLVKTNERENRLHKIYIAIHRFQDTTLLEAVIKQGRTRISEEYLVNDMISNLLLNRLDIAPLKNFNLQDGESISTRTENDKNLGYLINNETDLISSENLAPLKKLVVFSGSFNPIHDGHKAMIKMAQEITGEKPYLELTVNNADKGFLDYIELEDRIKNLDDYEFILTNAPTMKAKVEAIKKYAPMAEIIFVVGSDTYERVWDEKYGYSVDFLERFFKDNKIKFIMFKRGGYAPIDFTHGKDLLIKHETLESFETSKISSTDLRKSLTATQE